MVLCISLPNSDDSVIRNKKVFPTDDAAKKSVYLAIMQITKKWKQTRYGWPTSYNQLYLYFEDRIL